MSVRQLFTSDLEPKSQSTTVPLIKKVLTPIWQSVSAILDNGTTSSKEVRKREYSKRKLIAEHSRLSDNKSGVLKKTLDSSFFDKDDPRKLATLLGQLHGSRVIANSPLEKLPAHVGTQLMNGYLEEGVIPEEVRLTQALAQLSATAQEIHELPAQMKQQGGKTLFNCGKKLMQTVYDLKEGEAFFVTAEGIENSLTTSVIYEFRKEAGDHYELFVYLLAKEDSTYRTVLYNDRRHWVRPFMHYHHIPARKLFFNGPDRQEPQSDFFHALLETKIYKNTFNYSPVFAAVKLLGDLQTYANPTPCRQELSGFIASARSHTDGWHGIKAVALHYLGKEKYKQFAIELKCRSLIEGYNLGEDLLSQDSIHGAELRTILKTGAENLLRGLIIYERNQWISEELILAYRATALDLLKQIERLEKMVVQLRRQQSISITYTETDPTQARQKAIEAAKKEILIPRHGPQAIQTKAHERVEKLWKASEFVKELLQFNQSLNGNSTVDSAAIESLVALFPIPQSCHTTASYWNRIPQKQMSQAVDALQTLLTLYDRAYRKGEIKVSPQEANTVFSLFAIIHFLALQIEKKENKKSESDPSSISAYPIFFAGNFYDSDNFLSYTSPVDFKTRQNIRDYFQSTHFISLESSNSARKTLSPLFQFDSYYQFWQERWDNRTDSGFLKAIMDEHRGLRKSLFGSDFDDFLVLFPHLSPHKQDNLFHANGFSYIPALAYASFMAYQFSGYTHLRNDPEGKFTIQMDVKGNFGRWVDIDFLAGSKRLRDYSGWNQSQKLFPSSDPLYPKLDGNYRNRLLSSYVKRDKKYQRNNVEGEILLQSHIQKHESSALRFSCEAPLQPHQMLYDYRNRLDLFTNPHEQTFFEIEFFRSVLLQNHEYFSLMEELKQAGFVKECHRFIEEGVERYFYLQVGHRPHVMATLFFLRLSCRLSRFTNFPLIKPLPYIKKMLALSDLSEMEKSALSLHLILAYRDQKTLTDDQKKEILKAWIYYKNSPLPSERKSALLEKEVFAFLSSQVPTEAEFLTWKEEALAEALKLIGIQKLSSDYQLEKTTFPNIRAATAAGQFWEVNLLTGKIGNELGLLERGAMPDWIPKEALSRESYSTKLFRYLFKNREHAYFKTGTTIHFHDPVMGSIRVINGEIQRGLQRQIGSRWYQYIAPQKLEDYRIPAAFLADHTHWVPIDGHEKHLWICDFKSAQKRALIADSGLIHPIINGELDKSRTLAISDETVVLSKMDQTKYLTFTSRHGQLEKMTISRFCSLSKEPLEFEVKNGELVYGLNRKFYLIPNQKLGLLGGIPQYLVMAHQDEDKQKVLIPLRPLSKYNPLTSLHEIDTKDHHHSWSKEYDVPQNQIYTFLEFDLHGEKLLPLSNEGTLYLAYLFLAQRQYYEARELLDKIDYREKLSTHSLEILNYLITVCEQSHDSSPSSAAIVLKAYQLMEKSQMRFKKSPSCSRPIRALEIYNRNRETIPTGLEVYDLEFTVQQPIYQHSRPLLKDFVGRLKLQLPYAESCGFSKDYHDYSAYMNYGMAEKETEFVRDFSSASPDLSQTALSAYWGKGYTEHYFRQAYEIACKGSEEEKDQLRFRMQFSESLRLDKPHSNLDLKVRSNAWSILHFALKYPHLAPDLPSHDVVEAWNFLKKVDQLICDQSKKTQSATSTKPQETREGGEALNLTAPLLKTILPAPKKVKKVKKPLQLAPIAREAIDGHFLPDVFKLFQTLPQKEIPLEALSFDYVPPTHISRDEQAAQMPFEAEFADFQKDLKKGAEINQQREVYACDDPEQVNDILKEGSAAHLQGVFGIDHLQQEIQKLEIAILELANRVDPSQENKIHLLQEAKIASDLKMEKLIALFLMGDREEFEKANPYLIDPAYCQEIAAKLSVPHSEDVVIDYLYNMIGLFLTTSVYRQRLERAKKEKSVQKKAEELHPKHLATYPIEQYPVFLVFEYLSGYGIRPDQAAKLKKVLTLDPTSQTYIQLVFQMLMGSGKTTVIAVIFLKLAAKKGKLSIFITPSSQYSSVAHNLRKTHKEIFDHEMEDIDFPPDSIMQQLPEIEQRLSDAKRRGDFLIVKPETLQLLQLKFLTLSFDRENRGHNLGTINRLRRILLIFRKSGTALIDEVDLVLNILQEMNIPLGEKKFIHPARIDLIRRLFLLFDKTDAPIEEGQTVNLQELIRLKANRQTLLSETQLKNEVARAVAWEFGSRSSLLKLNHNPEFLLSFYRYISGQISTTCQKMLDYPKSEEYAKWESSLDEQDQKDFQFLTYVWQLRYSGEPDQEEAAHQIALIKHMMMTVLKVTFQKMGNRHYGRGLHAPGEVRPYLAPDTPSNNYFGYRYEWLPYHFQTAFQCGIQAPQLRELAALYREGAEASLKAKRLIFDEEIGEYTTPEAYEFKKMTGVNLEQIDQPGKLDEAVNNIQENMRSLLKLEAETAGTQVSYHPFRVTANGFSIVNMMESTRAMSATPFNAHCYEDCLADAFEPDWGTEGQIAEEMLKRVETEVKENHIHITRSRELKAFLKSIFKNHPDKDKCQILLDAGSLLSNYTGLEVAMMMRKLLKKPVFFFMRDPSKNEEHPDTLALLPLDSDTPRIIGGTRLKDIEKTGLATHEYCVYAPERQSTGMDCPLAENAIGIMTVDETMLRRTLFQTMLRLRQFFFKQRIEFAIPAEIIPQLPHSNAQNPQLKLFHQILLGTLRKQAIRKANDYLRSRKQKIDSLFEQKLLTEHLLLDRDLTEADLNKTDPFKSVLEIPQEDAPYDQFGAIEYEVNSIDDLKNYATRRLDTFEKAGAPLEAVAAIQREIDLVIKKAQNSPWLLKSTLRSSTNDLGMEADIHTDVNQEIDQDVNQEIDQELLNELSVYENFPHHYLGHEDFWHPEHIKQLFQALTKNQPFTPSTLPGQSNVKFDFYSLPELFNKCQFQYEQQSKKYQQYGHLFTDRIQVTRAWAYSTRAALPVFHRAQRPAEAILIYKNETGYKALLLSQYEAKRFKQTLHKNAQKDVWLILPDGSPFEDNPHQICPLDQISDLLLEINAFNGHLTYLESHRKEAELWLNQEKNLAQQFLSLRVARDPVRKKQFFISPLFSRSKVSQKQLAATRKYEKLANLTQGEIQALKDKKIIQRLSDEKLHWILPKQVQLLHPVQISKLRRAEHIQQIPQEHQKHIVPEQYPYLSEEQKSWLKPIDAPSSSITSHSSDSDDEDSDVEPTSSKSTIAPTKSGTENKDSLAAAIKPDNAFSDLHRTGPLGAKGVPENSSPASTQQFGSGNKSFLSPESPEHAFRVADAPDSDNKSTTPVKSSNPIPTRSTTPPISVKTIEKDSPSYLEVAKITLLTLTTLAVLGATLVGIFGTIGAHAAWSPQFMITISKFLNHTYISYIMISVGPAYLLILTTGLLIRKKCGKLHTTPTAVRA